MNIATMPLYGGLSVRPSTVADEPFVRSLKRSRLHSADRRPVGLIPFGKRVNTLVDLIVEKAGAPIGLVSIDFGGTEVRVIDMALTPSVQGTGANINIMQSIQRFAACSNLPVTLVIAHDNIIARRFYQAHGFSMEETNSLQDLLIWYPTPAESTAWSNTKG